MNPYGLDTVYDGEDAEFDLVFLHGLRGDMRATWTKKDVLWPEKLLPKEIERCRVILFGYDAGITHLHQSKVTQTDIPTDAKSLCAQLAAKRSKDDTSERPIILIAHSLGGLVAAQAIVLGAQEPDDSSATAVTSKVQGMIFLGTPFRGSNPAKYAETLSKVLNAFGVQTQPNRLKDLKIDSVALSGLLDAFADNLRKREKPEDKIKAFFFWEQLKTNIGVMYHVVPQASATLPGCGESIPINADHVNICKYDTVDDAGFGLVVAQIRRIMARTEQEASEAQAEVQRITNYGKIANIGVNQTFHGQTVNL